MLEPDAFDVWRVEPRVVGEPIRARVADARILHAVTGEEEHERVLPADDSRQAIELADDILSLRRHVDQRRDAVVVPLEDLRDLARIMRRKLQRPEAAVQIAKLVQPDDERVARWRVLRQDPPIRAQTTHDGEEYRQGADGDAPCRGHN
jgi:hypothetical protein